MKNVKVVVFHGACRGLSGISKMAMINVVISFTCKNLCLQITADVSKILKIAPGDVAFILNEIPERVNVFA